MPPGQDQYVSLPDGSYVHVPGDATPQQLDQLRTKLSSQYADPLKTGQGMEEKAHQQAAVAPLNKTPMTSEPPTGNAGTKERPIVSPEPGESFADTMKRGAEMGKTVTPEQIASSESQGIRDIPLVLGSASAPGIVGGLGESIAEGAPGLLKLGRGLIGATAGASLGERGGSDVGRLAGPTGEKVGGVLGAIGGGLLGGGLTAGLERNPATSLQSRRGIPGQIRSLPFGIQRMIPEWMVPKGELGSPTNPGPFMDIPGRMKIPTPLDRPFGRVPVTETGIPQMIHAPITSESNWLQNPEGNIQNVPRKEIPGLIKRTGDPAAVKEARRLGSAVLYVPSSLADK